MHPNMKNFYELLGIKKTIGIFLKISSRIDVEPPDVKILINETILHNGELAKEIVFQHHIEILESIDVKIELYNKNYKKSRNTAAIIESFKIDFLEIIPQWTQFATYENDHNNGHPTNCLGFNGIWNFKLNEPFYRWKHKINGHGWLLEP